MAGIDNPVPISDGEGASQRKKNESDTKEEDTTGEIIQRQRSDHADFFVSKYVNQKSD